MCIFMKRRMPRIITAFKPAFTAQRKARPVKRNRIDTGYCFIAAIDLDKGFLTIGCENIDGGNFRRRGFV